MTLDKQTLSQALEWFERLYAYRFAETALRAIVETLKGEPK